MPGATLLYFSVGSPATLGGLSVQNEDIVAWNGTTFSLFFDGSDVMPGTYTIDAFSIVNPNTILMSFTGTGSLTGVGTFDDSDILRFSASSLGNGTAGTWSMYFDGSDVALTLDAEDVDAIEVLANGHLLISTTGAMSDNPFIAQDEDVIEFTPTTLGDNTAGSWSMYFDGSDVGVTDPSDGIDALAVSPTGLLYLSTGNNFSVPGLSGEADDVFIFVPTSLGDTTEGVFSPTLFFDGSAFGLSGNDIFAIDLP